MKKIISLIVFTCTIASTHAQQSSLPAQQDRWKIQPDGSIEWAIDNRVPHNDHLEMSGEKISLWVQYGVNEKRQATLDRTMEFPTFRLLPVRTIASMMYNVTDGEFPRFLI